MAAELNRTTRGRSAPEKLSIFSLYLDTPDHRLASAGLVWRLQNEGRRWIQRLGHLQALPGTGDRADHEVLVSPSAPADARRHAGTPLGDQLLRLLGKAEAEAAPPSEVLRCEFRRTVQILRSHAATLEVSLDEGTLIAGGQQQRLCDLGMRLLEGPAEALDALAQRWVGRFQLIVEPRTPAERGLRLSLGQPSPPLRKARLPAATGPDRAVTAAAAAIDECVAQITHNAIGLLEGDDRLRVEHVHQLRVGIRRLRCALRCFRGWENLPAEEAAAGLRPLFTTLGTCRNADVLDSGVAAELERAGAPPVTWATANAPLLPADILRSDDAQRSLRQWQAWRWLLLPQLEPDPAPQVPGDAAIAVDAVDAVDAAAALPEANPSPASPLPAAGPLQPARDPALASAELCRLAERRLLRWHTRIVAEARAFDELDEAALHALRKRVKRQRYAVEFMGPLLRRRTSSRYLVPLAALQDRLGELNDLFVAREAYRSRLEQQPAAWFALGWLAARITQTRATVQEALLKLSRVEPPRARN